jgi:hypothetical protein
MWRQRRVVSGIDTEGKYTAEELDVPASYFGFPE